MIKAHRAAYAVWNGPIADGLHVLHKCDNPRCINPGHLWLGTNADNVADRDAKGRQVALKGADHARARLTEDQIIEIMRSDETQETLACLYGVSQSHISRIKHRQAWKHL